MLIDFKDIKTGVYRCSVEKVSEGSSKWGKYVKFDFILLDPGFENVKVSGIAGFSLSKNSKLFSWIKSILGYEPVGIVDTDSLIGKTCFIDLSKSNSFFSVINVSDEPPF